MMRRMSFNGGEISPDLHLRSDLERYYSSCRMLDNFLVKPSGAVTRRPPCTALAHVLNPGRATLAARVFPFKYSEDTVYLVVLSQLDGVCTITVYDSAGVVKDTIASAPWDEVDLYAISFCQTNDVLFLAHSSVPVQRLERHGDTDWRLVEHEFRGGPWRAMNLDQSAVISLTVPRWSSSATYAVGDMVDNFDSNFTITAVGHSFWKKIKINVETDNSGADWNTTKKKIKIDLYYTTFTVADTTGLVVGKRIEVSGTQYHNGTYEVLKLTSTKVYVNTGAAKYSENGTTKNWYNTDTLPSTPSIHYNDGLFYECIQAYSTSHHHVTEDDYWREVKSYNGTVTLTCHAGIFTAAMVGTRMRIETERPDTYLRGTFLADGSSKAFPVAGVIRLTSNGRWTGNMDLELSTDGGANWTSIAQISSNDADYNGEVERDIDEPHALIRVTMTNYATPDKGKGALWTLSPESRVVPVIVNLTHYTSATQMEGEVEESMFLAENTWRWYEDALGPKHGYPRAICVFDERLMIAGTTTDPHRIWGSAINDWQDFAPGTLETSPIDFAIASDSLQRIMWMAAKQELMLGTDGGEYTMSARDADKAISGSNIRVKRQTEHGSAPIQAVPTAEAVAYVQRARRSLRMSTYAYEADGYVSLDMSVLAQHLTDGGLREIAYQRVPYGVLWIVRDDGVLLSLTYNKDQQVMGWATHSTWDDGFVSVAVVPGTDSDDVYVLTQRGERVYLEKMADPGVTGSDAAAYLQTNTSWLDWLHTSSNLGTKVNTVTLCTAPGAVATTWPLAVYGDGRLLDEDEWSIAYDNEAAAYKITTDSTFYRIDVGIPYTSTVKPTDPAVNPQAGTAASDTFRASEVQLHLIESMGGEVSLDDGETYNPLPYLLPTAIPGRALQPETGMKRVAVTGGNRRGMDLIVRTSNAGPFTLAMLAVALEKRSD